MSNWDANINAWDPLRTTVVMYGVVQEPVYPKVYPYPYPVIEKIVVTETISAPKEIALTGDALADCEARLAAVRAKRAEVEAELKKLQAAELVLDAGVKAMKAAKGKETKK